MNKTQLLYEGVIGHWWTHNFMNNKLKYCNLGYWTKKDDTYDSACQRMAELVADEAELNEKDVLLDVGFGFGEQDVFWLNKYRVKHITGINITHSQLIAAQKMIKERGLEDKIDFQFGWATKLSEQFGKEKFTKVTALECAFHFDTRDEFFREAFKVLKPGGKLVTADIIHFPEEVAEQPSWFWDFIQSGLWQIPKCNHHGTKVYKERLEQAGFVNVKCYSIVDNVYEPLWWHCYEKLKSPEIASKFHWSHRQWLTRYLFATFFATGWPHVKHDYCIAVAEKPK